MTTRKSAAASQATAETPVAEAPDANPSAGGSYVREPDGTLNRVEYTADETAEAEQPAESEPAAEGGEAADAD